MARELHTLRGELHCFACARYLGDFESHPELHGKADLHLLASAVGELPEHAIATDHGLRCSRCGGRVVLDYVEKATVALAA